MMASASLSNLIRPFGGVVKRQQGTQPCEGNTCPSRSVPELIRDFKRRLFHKEKRKQPLRYRLALRPQRAVAHRLRVGRNEAVTDLVAPRAYRLMQLVPAIWLTRRRIVERGPRRVVERSQHAGDIAQDGMLGATLHQRELRRPLEVHDEHVILDNQYLAEMVVAVTAGNKKFGVNGGERANIAMHLRSARGELVEHRRAIGAETSANGIQPSH